MEQTNIFLSYCWKDDEIANDIYDYFKGTHGVELHRDKINIEAWNSIKEYMQSIENMDYTILVISDEYLKSPNCMYEVLEVIKDVQYRDKIFPVVVEKKIYSMEGIVYYIKYWKNEYEKANGLLNGLSPVEMGPLGKKVKRCEDIKNSIADFLDVISDMNNPGITNINLSIETKLSNKGLIVKKPSIDVEKFIYDYDYYLTIGDDGIKKLIEEISDEYSCCEREYFDVVYKKKPSYFHIEDRNKGFWNNFIYTDNEIVLDGIIEFLYTKRDLFTEVWYKEYPVLFKMIVDKHKIFIQEQLNPLLENNWYIDDVAFWKLLCEILEFDATLIDLSKVTNQYQKVMMINNYNLLQKEIDVLNKYDVFKQFICNACKSYFYNDAQAQWDYYSYGSYDNDSYPEKCFDLANIDLELIEKLESAYFNLLNNVKFRDNYNSIENGRIRKSSYNRVIATNKNKIVSAINNASKTISDYPSIEQSMKEQNLI